MFDRMRARLVIVAAVVAVVLAAPAPAHASHHLWHFSQLYSNASGSVQFIQMLVDPEDGEDQIATVAITGGSQPFTFSANLSKTTTTVNKWILIATPGFASLPGGVTPDFTIPANFLSTGGGTLHYGGGDTWTYGTLPTDGVNALHKSGATVTTSANTPENFNLQSGSVTLTAAVPALPAAGIAVLVGALLLAGSGLLRRRAVKTT
jgi:hypothetical protein